MGSPWSEVLHHFLCLGALLNPKRGDASGTLEKSEAEQPDPVPGPPVVIGLHTGRLSLHDREDPRDRKTDT